MTQARLSELMSKAQESKIEINELAEICGAILESVSRHSKEIKSRLKNLEDQVNTISTKLEEIAENQSPAFGVILEDEED